MTPIPLRRFLIGSSSVHWLVKGSYASAVLRHSWPLKPPQMYTLPVRNAIYMFRKIARLSSDFRDDLIFVFSVASLSRCKKYNAGNHIQYCLPRNTGILLKSLKMTNANNFSFIYPNFRKFCDTSPSKNIFFCIMDYKAQDHYNYIRHNTLLYCTLLSTCNAGMQRRGYNLVRKN